MTQYQSPFRVRLAGGISLLALCISQSLHASEQPPSQNEEDIVALSSVMVTGTNVRGAEPAGNVVSNIEASDIEKTGAASLGDLVRDLPANFSGGVGTSDNSGGGGDNTSGVANLTGGQGVNLRGLGALSTLVLINGRRVPASGQFGDFVDISNVPISAIDRIEVLQDGASAVYGSDAVGGVFNIILKSDFTGNESTASFGTDLRRLSHVFGTSWDSGNVVIGAEYSHQDRRRSSDVDMINGGDFSPHGGVNWRTQRNRVSTVANLFSGTPSGAGNVTHTVPNGTPVPTTDGIGTTSDPWENIDITPRMTRASLFGSVQQNIFDTATLYADLRYTRRSGDYNNGYLELFETLPATNPYALTGISNNFSRQITERGLTREVGVDSYGVNLGVRFDLFGDWQGDLTFSYGADDQSRKSTLNRDSNLYAKLPGPGGTTVDAPSPTACSLMGLDVTSLAGIANPTNAQRYCALLGYTPFNPYSTSPIPDAVLDQLIGTEDLSYRSRLKQFTYKMDGALTELPGGTLRMAAGVDHRNEFIDGELNFNTRSIHTTHVPYGATERDVSAAFVEFALPIVGKNNRRTGIQAFDLSVAYRHERYDAAGSLNDYSTSDPKFGFRYRPIKGLDIQGSWGTSFHAPPMRYTYTGPQPVNGGNATFVLPATYMAPCDTTAVRLNGYIGTPGSSGQCSLTAMIVAGGAESLRPESATTWTLGFDWNPEFAPNLRVGLSYYNLEIEDRIVRIQSSTLPGILSSYLATGSSPYAANINLSPTVSQAQALLDDPRFIGQFGPPVGAQGASDIAAIINATNINLGLLRMNGFDFKASYDFDLNTAGYLKAFLIGTYINAYETKNSNSDSDPWVDMVNTYSALGNPVDLRSRLGLTWNLGGYQASLTWNHTAGYTCEAGCMLPNPVTGAPVASTTPVPISSWNTFDMHVSYDFEGESWLGTGTSLGLSISNLTDRDPPFVPIAGNGATIDPYDVANANIHGRNLLLTLKKSW